MSASFDDVLELAAQTLEENPERWTRDVMFRDEWGASTGHPAHACSACALGMVYLASVELGRDDGSPTNDAGEAERRYHEGSQGWDLGTYNDVYAQSARQVADTLRSLKDNDPDA